MPILALSLKSIWNRRVTAFLTVVTIAVSIVLVLGVDKVRTQARASFTSTISGTDLIVGARSGAVQLLLYSVFRIGNATSNISWESYRELAERPEVAWTIPLSLGDSHRGFRVLGTTDDYFKHFKYGNRQTLRFADGVPFEDLFDTVLGADVADALGYELGDRIVLDHGLGAAGFSRHTDRPFTVVGILAKTGTPVDRTVHVSLGGIEAIHIDWKGGTRVPGTTFSADDLRKLELHPRAITAALFGLKSRLSAFGLQRHINEYRAEPLLAIFPGVALQELWNLMGTAEAALAFVSAIVVVASLLGMLTMLLAGLDERRREMAILRSVGARPHHIFALLIAEAVLLAGLGILLGLALLYLALVVAQPVVNAEFGLFLPVEAPTLRDLAIMGLVLGAAVVAGAIPALRAYRQSLADGMTVRL